MRYVAAYLLSALSGKESPSNEDIEKILSSVGIESDSEKLNIVIQQLSGKKIDDVVAKGREKLASVPTGGAAVATAAATGGPAAAAAPAGSPEKKEEKKEAKKVESEESDDDMGFGLFD